MQEAMQVEFVKAPWMPRCAEPVELGSVDVRQTNDQGFFSHPNISQPFILNTPDFLWSQSCGNFLVHHGFWGAQETSPSPTTSVEVDSKCLSWKVPQMVQMNHPSETKKFEDLLNRMG